MKWRIGYSGLSVAALLAACGGNEGPGVVDAGQGAFTITTGALTIPGPVANATYKVKVQVLTENGYVDFQEFDVSAQDGALGAANYVGTCLASGDGTPVSHLATITLASATDANGNSLLDDCTGTQDDAGNFVTTVPFDCYDGGDSGVNANFNLMCDLDRGFTDFTFSVNNVYCQTKIDCVQEPLLWDPNAGERVRAAVVGAQCTKDPSGGTDFQVPVFVEFDCRDATGVAKVDVTANKAFYFENYQGTEALEDVLYNNTVYSLTADAFAGASKCTMTVYTWPEATVEGRFAATELRKDAAIMVMTTTITIDSEKGVQCSDTVVEPTILPALEVIGKENTLTAIGYSFAGQDQLAYLPLCASEYQTKLNELGASLIKLDNDQLAFYAQIDDTKQAINEADSARQAQVVAYDESIIALETIEKVGVEAAAREAEWNNGFLATTRESFDGIIAAYDTNADLQAALERLRAYRGVELTKQFDGLVNLTSDIVAFNEDYAAATGDGSDSAIQFGNIVAQKDVFKADVAAIERAIIEPGVDVTGLIAEARDGIVATATSADREFRQIISLQREVIKQTSTNLREADAAAAKDYEAYTARLKESIAAIEDSLAETVASISKVNEEMAATSKALTECESRANPLLVRSGVYDATAFKGANMKSDLFGSESKMDGATTFADICSDEDGYNRFGYFTRDGYHSMATLFDGKNVTALAGPGLFAFDEAGNGNKSCLYSHTAYSGDLGRDAAMPRDGFAEQ